MIRRRANTRRLVCRAREMGAAQGEGRGLCWHREAEAHTKHTSPLSPNFFLVA